MSYSENLSDLGLYLSTCRKQLIPDLLAECDFIGGYYVAASSSSARFGRFARMLALFLLFFMIVVPASSSAILTVDQSGSGDYMKIQDAINAVPSQNNDRLFIFVSPGTYRLLCCSFSVYHLYADLSLSLSLYIICIPISLLFPSVSLYIVYLSIYLSINLSIYLSIYLFIYLGNLYVHLSNYLCINLNLSISIYQVYLSIRLFHL